MAEPLLEIKDLHVHFDVYGGTLKVLNGVSLVVNPAERVGVVGETGCGKTVTMKAVLGTLPVPPTRIVRGEVIFQGRDLLKLPPSERQRIKGRAVSMIFQDPMSALNPVFTIGQQLNDVIRYSANTDQRLSRREIHRRATAILREVQLPDPDRIMHNYPCQLSGGMRQRVLIAMALVTEPQLLIADEPGTALDVTIQDQILKLLKALVDAKGVSVLLITHNLGVIRELSDRVYVMYAGNVVETAPTKALFARPAHPYTQGLLDSVPQLTGAGVPQGIRGMIPDYANPPPGCRFHPRCDHAMPICKERFPPILRVGERHEVACFIYGSKSGRDHRG